MVKIKNGANMVKRRTLDKKDKVKITGLKV